MLEILRKEKYFHLLDNIWGTDLSVTQLRNKFNTGFRLLLCVTDIFNKYGYVLPLKDKKWITIITTFQKILDKFKKKPNKI